MVNCNPETVSTDYDTSDRLYFEPLTAEDVVEIVRVEERRGTLLGVIVQFGGQTPLKLAAALERAGIPILGTSPDAIDLAEDRRRFQGLLDSLGLRQAKNGTAQFRQPKPKRSRSRIGYPVMIRPSYVLGGRAMEIVHDGAALERLHARCRQRVRHQPGTDRSLSAERDRGRCRRSVRRSSPSKSPGSWNISRRPEYILATALARCHRIASAADTIVEIERQTVALARALGVVGLMNVQFAVKGDEIYVLEVNPRASRGRFRLSPRRPASRSPKSPPG